MKADPTSRMLDGRAILRFAHAFESSVGTERYLDDLDHAFLERNAMTIARCQRMVLIGFVFNFFRLLKEGLIRTSDTH